MATVNISGLSSVEKISQAMLGAGSKIPGEAGAALKSMLTPQNLSIMAGVVALWVGSHAFGIGAIIDIILLSVGAAALGWSVFEGAEELYKFATTATSASSEQDLDLASEHFAKAVTILGLSAIQAMLLKGQVKPMAAKIRSGPMSFKPQPRIMLPQPPAANSGLELSRPPQISGTNRTLGRTDAFGRIRISRFHPQTAAPIPISKQKELLYHELVHRYFSPKTGPLRKLRAEFRISGYQRIAFLRYLEETLAQGYAMLRMHGLQKGLAAYRFPIEHGYVTVSQLAAEGTMVGTIMVGGNRLYVSLSAGHIQNDQVELATDDIQEEKGRVFEHYEPSRVESDPAWR